MTFIYPQINLSYLNKINNEYSTDTTTDTTSQCSSLNSIPQSSQNPKINSQPIWKNNLKNICNLIKFINKAIYRDIIISIREKIKFSVISLFKSQYPSKTVLQWDLWGLFFNVSFLGINLHNIQEEYDYFHNNLTLSVFIMLMFWVFIGSIVIYVNLIISVNSNWSFFYIISMFGYSLYPFNIILAIYNILYPLLWIKCVGMIIALIWTCFIFWNFIRISIPRDQKGIALYPVILNLLFMNMFILDSIYNG